MTILFLDQFAQIAGAQRCLLDLVPAIRERGWAMHAAVPGPGPLADALAGHGATVHPIRCGPYGLGRKSARDVLRFTGDVPRLAGEISAILEASGADLLYINGPRLLPPAVWAARNGTPVVFHCHNYLARRYAAAIAGSALRATRADVIACCEFVAGPLAPYVNSGHLQVVYNGVPASDVPPRAAPPEKWRVGVIGRTAVDKGQELFIEAARLLAREGAPCEFVICGVPLLIESLYVERLRKMAGDLPFTFLGWQADPADVFSALDMLVVPSGPTEATPRVIMEAFAAGVPVLAFRTGGIPEITVHGENAFLLNRFTPEALARAIRDLTNAPEALARMAANGRRAARERFAVERWRSDVLNIIELAAGRRKAPVEARTATPP